MNQLSQQINDSLINTNYWRSYVMCRKSHLNIWNAQTHTNLVKKIQ